MRVLRGVLDPAATEEAVQTLKRLSEASAGKSPLQNVRGWD